MKKCFLLLSLVLTLFVSCDIQDKVYNRDISDGAHDGNEHFFFLPPLAPLPDYSGTFDGTLNPEVEIVDSSDSNAPIAHFSLTSGSGSEVIRVVPEEEHYIVNFHLNKFPLIDSHVYRISVVLPGNGQVLGYADILFEEGKCVSQTKNGEPILLINGKTLPIKFRIELGAILYSLSGNVSLYQGGVLEGAQISAVPEEGTHPAYTAVSDTEGNYTINNLPGGTYAVTAFKVGYVVKTPARTVVINGSDADHIDFTAFEELIYEGDYTIYNQNDLDAIVGYTGITGNLVISSEFELVNLDGLEHLIHVDGSLRIENNIILEDLNGLSNLSTIGSNLIINGTYMRSFSGMASLISIGYSLDIQDCWSLEDLNGFENITVIHGNLVLSPRGPLHSVDGLANLTRVERNFTLSETSLNDLSPLVNLVSVGGDLSIVNTRLENFTGLNNLESIGGFLNIHYNESLEDLGGLNRLTSAEGILIDSNSLLMNIDALKGLTAVNSVRIIYNSSLMNLGGFSNLVSINGSFSISENSELNSLGLDNLWYVGGGFAIRNNILLSTGLALLLRDQVLAGGGILGTIDISGNMP